MVGPNYARPAVEQPAHFKSQADGEPAPPIASEWWQLYGDRSSIDSSRPRPRRTRPFARRWHASTKPARSPASRPAFSSDDLYQSGLHTSPHFWNRDSTITGQRVQQGVTVNDWVIPFDLAWELDVWAACAVRSNRPGPRPLLAPMTPASSG